MSSNIVYDTVNPSGQAASNLIAFIARPTAGVGPFPVVMLGPGKGWVEQTNICSTQAALSSAIVAEGYVTIAAYTTWASASQVVSAHSPGDSTITVSAIDGDTGNWWFPNISGCPVDDCKGINPPFNGVYGVGGVNREPVTVTAQDATGKILTLQSPLVNTHSADERFYIQQTESPVNVRDYSSLFNWIGSNIASFKGDAQRIHLFGFSSDSQGQLMAALNAPGVCLISCLPLTNYNGFNAAGSSNALSSWAIVPPLTPVSVPWDLNYIFDNGATSGTQPSAVQHVVPALLGCTPGVDTDCASAASAASPVNYLNGNGYAGSITSATGNDDFTTPPCPYLSTWGSNAAVPTWTPNQAPCPGNMYAETNQNFVVFQGPGQGHTSDCDTNQTATGQCWVWFNAAIAGDPLGNGYIGGTVTLSGAGTLQ